MYDGLSLGVPPWKLIHAGERNVELLLHKLEPLRASLIDRRVLSRGLSDGRPFDLPSETERLG